MSLWLALLCIVGSVSCRPFPSGQSSEEALTNKYKAGINGKVVDMRGNPAAGSFVYAYRNMRQNLRGPADFEAKVNAKGEYFLDLVEGDYYLIARMRRTGADAGPPRSGDAWALPGENPVTVHPNSLSKVDFTLQNVTQPMLLREGTLTSGDTGFTGLLLDLEGQPVTGAFVIAYPDTRFQHMPEATSPAVGENGRFHLYVERTGQWCLAARTRTRGQPMVGELYGQLGQQDKSCRFIDQGQMMDVGSIVMEPYR
jgi:hypothetical protein